MKKLKLVAPKWKTAYPTLESSYSPFLQDRTPLKYGQHGNILFIYVDNKKYIIEINQNRKED